ncbi:MAG TPA: ribosome silencing factor, partial [Candidatus Scatomorpha pullicola]|nr:ribosome silencing factor [Candidatus Scatomorpha pullicola]
MLTPKEVAAAAVKTLDAKQAKDITLLRTADVTVLADYFVICTATSSTHVKTLTDEVDRVLSDMGEPPMRREGYRGGGWILLDFGCVIVHIFQ